MCCRALLVALAAAPVLVSADKYAVLIAGSSGWSNYRHQADVAHAYTILTQGGVKPENIITFMYDDIADNFQNKFKGQLFNQPGSAPVDVYAALKDHIDYKKGEVTPSNFLKVLTGDKSANGRVLQSGPDDDVFIYFADHGGVGILAFPDALIFPRSLSAEKINGALQTMHQKQMYKRLVFYVEACESGSIFDGLLNASLGVYAVTAANPRESSWGWYCGDEGTGNNTVKGKHLGVCLGDEFSVRWMEDTDAADETKETLSEQFSSVQSAVTKSHVQKYGDDSFAAATPLATFLGDEHAVATALGGGATMRSARPAIEGLYAPPSAAVDSRDANLVWLQWRLNDLRRANGASAADLAVAEAELAEELRSREQSTKLFGAVWNRVSGMAAATMLERYMPPRRFACHDGVVESAKLRYTDFSLKYHRVVVNLCEMGFDMKNISIAFTALAQE
jgi:legumain